MKVREEYQRGPCPAKDQSCHLVRSLATAPIASEAARADWRKNIMVRLLDDRDAYENVIFPVEDGLFQCDRQIVSITFP
jgi:hypothetical protein